MQSASRAQFNSSHLFFHNTASRPVTQEKLKSLDEIISDNGVALPLNFTQVQPEVAPRGSRPTSCAPRRRVCAQFCSFGRLFFFFLIVICLRIHLYILSCFKSVRCPCKNLCQPLGSRSGHSDVLTSPVLGAASACRGGGGEGVGRRWCSPLRAHTVARVRARVYAKESE